MRGGNTTTQTGAQNDACRCSVRLGRFLPGSGTSSPGLSEAASLPVLIALGGLAYVLCLMLVARGLVMSALEFMGLPRNEANLKD